jgi:hypothetical protein
MKKFTLTFIFLCAFGALTFAGSERYSGKDKEIMQQAPPACDWYRAHEWDLDLWGAYAFAGNTGFNDPRRLSGLEGKDPEGTGVPAGADDPNSHVDLGPFHNDRFINRDGSWAGGADVKYFFSKYWALGAEGFIVDANNNSAGGGLGTFTFRYPIGCSRFAPYAFAGFGVVAGGEHSLWFQSETHHLSQSGQAVVENEFRRGEGVQNKHAEADGQFGAGLEVRLTHRIGVMSDFAWNVISGPDNNFGMLRFGATLSY